MQKGDVLSQFGRAVKAMRNGLGMSQEELAWRAGLHRTYVSDVERGARNLSLESIEKLARALETSISHLFLSATHLPGPGTELPQGWRDSWVKILLIEDNPADVEMTLEAFARAKITNTIKVARDGAEALDCLFCPKEPENQPLHRRVQVILLDLNLPKVSGLEVLRRIKQDERTRNIPVIVLTDSQDNRDVSECRQLGVHNYIVKPVDFQRFSAVTPELSFRWALLKPSERLSA